MTIITTDRDVLVIPKHIMNHFGGEIIHPSNPSKLVSIVDPDGDYTIGMGVLDDPEWDYLGELDFGGKTLRELLIVKKYKYVEENL